MFDFTYRNGSDNDFENIKQLCDLRYGTGYFTEKTMMSFMKCPDLFKIAEENGRFVGFAAFIATEKEKIAESMKLDIGEVMRISGEKPAVIYKSHAIKAEYEKMGLPVAMTSMLLEEGKRLGYGSVFASAWKYGEIIPMEKTFKKLDFIPLEIRENLWYDDENYRCIVCGGRCRCEAMLYYRVI